MKRRISYIKFALWLIAALPLASCSQDELAEQGTPLPDGIYPMTFTAVQVAPENMPQTRVSDSGNTSSWSVGDQIHVTVAQGDAMQETICTLDASGNITDYNPQLYWQNTDNATINAQYSNIEGQNTGTGNTVSLANQSGGLAYVLKAASVTANYKTEVENIALKFYHQLAKIRVKLTGEKADNVNTVQVKSYTQCTNDKGTVSGSNEGWITLKKCIYNNETCWEANVVPDHGITEIQLNGSTPCKLTGIVNPVAGHYHEITINAEGKDFTVTEDYTIEGEHKPIIIAGNYTVTFKDARITSDDRPVIKINDGCRPTLVFEGENVLKGNITSGQDDEYSIKLENDAKLAVISEDTPIGSTYNRIKLKISGNGEMWVQSNGHDSPAIIVRNGSLDVSGGVNLTAVSTNISWGNIGNLDYIPAIGRAAYSSGVIGGNITLSDCTLKLYAWAKGGKEPQNWVSLENGTVTPDVDSALKDAAWDTEVSLSNKVKAKKLKDRPTPPDWAQ